MKKLRRALCLIAVLAMCLSLCGCSILDDLRQMRAEMTSDGTIRLYDGTEYKPLPQCEELSPSFSEYSEVYTVAEDVPLLLTTVLYEDYLDKSDDGKFLVTYSEAGAVYYCRADAYDSVLARIQNGFTPDLCCYWCYDFENMEDVCYTLTQKQLDLLNQVVATQKPQVLPNAASLDSEHWADLYLCSEDRLFEQDTVDICILNGKYYVMDFGDTISFYAVPAELTAEFEKIMEMQIQYDSYWYD